MAPTAAIREPGPPPRVASPRGLARARIVGDAPIEIALVASVGELGLWLWLGDGDAGAAGLGLGGTVGGSGGTVGGVAGGGVGRGVDGGGAVGGGVGVGVGGAVADWTTIVPCIVGWMEQW